MKPRILAMLLCTLFTLASPAFAGVNSRSPQPVEARTLPSKSLAAPNSPTPGSRADQKRYAARDAKAKNAKKYRGGDVVVITATAAIIILLGIIIILLIT